MALPPSFTGESEVANQATTGKQDAVAFELPDGTIRLLYGIGSATIKYQDYNPISGTWGAPLDVHISGVPSPRGDTLAADMDDDGNIMIVYGTSTGVGSGIYARLLRVDGSFSSAVNMQYVAGGVLTEKQYVVHAGGNTFTYIGDVGTIPGIKAADYNPATGNWANVRTVVDRSTAGSPVLNNIKAFVDVNGLLHVAWRELNGATYSIGYQQETGAYELVDSWASPANGANPCFVVDNTDPDNVILVTTVSSDPTGSRVVVYKRTSGGWDAGTDLDVNADTGQSNTIWPLRVDRNNNVHLLYNDASDAVSQKVYYVRSIDFGVFGTAVQVSFGGGGEAARQGSVLKRKNIITDEEIYVFWGDTRPGGGFTVWWNTCDNCIVTPPKQYGTCIEVSKGALTPDHYELVIGQTAVWGGGPLSHGDTELVQTGAAGEIIVDAAYPMEATGKLESWYFWRGSTSVGDLEIGDLYLLVYRNGLLVHRVPNSKVIPAGEGLHELSAGLIDVREKDLIGVWMASGSNSIKANTPTNTLQTLYRDPNKALPAVGAALPAGPTDDEVTTLVVRGSVIEEDTILVGYATDGTNEDSDGYLDFTLTTDAFADGSVTNPGNLFDSSAATAASVAAGATGNVYYHAAELAAVAEDDQIPVERVELDYGAIPAGGKLRVYVSNAETANTLVAAQAIDDWVQIFELDENSRSSTSFVLHIAQRARWIRLEIVGGTGLATTVNACEVQVMMARIENGEFTPHPTAARKDRFYLDLESHRHAAQISGIIDIDLGPTSTFVQFTQATPDEFFDQFNSLDQAVIVQGGRGVENRGQKVAVLSVDKAAKSINLTNFIGQSFTAGALLMPLPKWFQARAKDASGNTIGRTLWMPSIGTAEEWIRSHAIYTGDT